MGLLINYHKHIMGLGEKKPTFREILACYLYHGIIVGGTAGAFMAVEKPMMQSRSNVPNGSAAILMKADSNGYGNGKLEEAEAMELLFSRRIDKNQDGVLSSDEIRDARNLAEEAKEVVPNHAKVLLSTIDAIELKQSIKKAE